ncbi:MAG: Gldg family protein [Myxococcales bacterium]|nr:Gldg family protein [Myxococcales bacterium]
MSDHRSAGGWNELLTTVLLLASLVVVVELADRHPARIDLTEEGSETLDPDTTAALASLDAAGAQARITAFSAQARDPDAAQRDRVLRDRLTLLEQASARVEVRFVDFDRERLTAERLGVTRYGSVVVEIGDRRVDVSDRDLFRYRNTAGRREPTFVGEAALSAAIRRCLSSERRTLVLLSGHGEVPIFDRGIGELHALADRAEEQGLTVRTVDLLRAGEGRVPEIPPDASAVLAIGPRAPLAASEEAALRSFLGAGGGVGWWVEPGGALPSFIEDLGVDLQDGWVMDPATQLPHLDRPLLRYGRHPITEAVSADDLNTIVATAAGLAFEPKDGVEASTLLQTGPRGWLERGGEQPPVWTEGVDTAGPVTVALALGVVAPHPIARAGQRGRLVVVGDVDLVRDELMEGAPGNATFVTNVLRWLVGSEAPLSRVGRTQRVRTLQLDRHQLDVVRLWLVGGMPMLVAAVGALVLRVRRSR